jgi:hypothetical protein
MPDLELQPMLGCVLPHQQLGRRRHVQSLHVSFTRLLLRLLQLRVVLRQLMGGTVELRHG